MTKKNIRSFIYKYIRSSDTVKSLLSKEKDIISNDENILFQNLSKDIEKFDRSTKGFIYEKLWDICIKLGIFHLIDKSRFKKIEHGFGNINNINNSSFNEFKNKFDKYMDEHYISGNSGGYSDITYRTVDHNNIKELNLISVKYYENEKDIKSYDIQNICTIIDDRKNDGYNKINVCLFVKNKKNLIDKITRANSSSNILIKYISPYGNYENIYDENDLEVCFIKLKKRWILRRHLFL